MNYTDDQVAMFDKFIKRNYQTLTQHQMARRLGVSQPYVGKRLAALGLERKSFKRTVTTQVKKETFEHNLNESMAGKSSLSWLRTAWR